MKLPLFHLISLFLLAACVANGVEQSSLVQWEYKIWVQPDNINEISGEAAIETELNELGQKGWELVTVMWKKHRDGTSPNGRAIHYFKRRIQTDFGEDQGDTRTKSNKPY